jgi:hypothetical protein
VDRHDPAGRLCPYVQGIIKHEGSGFSLTGSTSEQLTNFTIDRSPFSSSVTSPSTAPAATQVDLFNSLRWNQAAS